MNENKVLDQAPKWLISLLPLFSTILGGTALWLAWARYKGIVNGTEVYWYAWIQPIALVLVGILCFLAAVLFISGKASAWPVFKAGLSIVPLILFINLLILIFRVIQSILQGNGISFISRLYASPVNKVILAVVIFIILSSIVKEIKQNSQNK